MVKKYLKNSFKNIMALIFVFIFILQVAVIPKYNVYAADTSKDYLYKWYKCENKDDVWKYAMQQKNDYGLTNVPIIIVSNKDGNSYYMTCKNNTVSWANSSNVPELNAVAFKTNSDAEIVTFETLNNVSDLYVSNFDNNSHKMYINNFNFSTGNTTTYQYNPAKEIPCEVEFLGKTTVYVQDHPEYGEVSGKKGQTKTWATYHTLKYSGKTTEMTAQSLTCDNTNKDYIVFEEGAAHYLKIITDSVTWTESKDSDYERQLTYDLETARIYLYSFKTVKTSGKVSLNCQAPDSSFLCGKSDYASGYFVYVGCKVAYPTLTSSLKIENVYTLDNNSSVKDGNTITVKKGETLYIKGTCINKGLIVVNGGTLVVSGMLLGPDIGLGTMTYDGTEYQKGSVIAKNSGTIIITENTGVIACCGNSMEINLKSGSTLYNYNKLYVRYLKYNGAGFISAPNSETKLGSISSTYAWQNIKNGVPDDKFDNSGSRTYNSQSITRRYGTYKEIVI